MKQKQPHHEVLLRRLAQGDKSATTALKSLRFPGQADRLRTLMATAPTAYARLLAAEVLEAMGTPSVGQCCLPR